MIFFCPRVSKNGHERRIRFMKKRIRIIPQFAAIMFTAMMVFTGCGKKRADLELPDPETMTFAVSAFSDEGFTGDVENFCMKGGRLYFMATDIQFQDGEDSAADSEETVSRGERTILFSIWFPAGNLVRIRMEGWGMAVSQNVSDEGAV